MATVAGARELAKIAADAAKKAAEDQMIANMENDWTNHDQEIPILHDLMIKALKNKGTLFGTDGKKHTIPANYDSYAKLNHGQKAKVAKFWKG